MHKANPSPCRHRRPKAASCKYENAYTATMLGDLACCKFYPGELVYAVLRFQVREYNGQMFQDILVTDLVKLNH